MAPIRTLALALVPTAALAASGGAPLTLQHSGYLLGADDLPADGPTTLGFSLVTTASGATTVEWQASCPVDVAGGYYAVTLGAGTCAGTTALDTADLPANSARFLEISVAGVALSPRLPVTPALPGASGDLAGGLASPTVVAIQGSPVSAAAPTNGQVLTWNATAGEWQAQTPPEPTPAAGGDSEGTVDAATVVGLRGRTVASTAPADGELLVWDAASSVWKPGGLPATVAGDHAFTGSISVAGNLTLASTGATCSGASTKGALRYNDANGSVEVCDGASNWVLVGGSGAAGGGGSGSCPTTPVVLGATGASVDVTAPAGCQSAHFKLWAGGGGGGGGSGSVGGGGGYAEGWVQVTSGDVLTLVVGGGGAGGRGGSAGSSPGGWPGGGSGNTTDATGGGGGGGGYSGVFKGAISQANALLVAGAGGGGAGNNGTTGFGGAGGGVAGQRGGFNNVYANAGVGGTISSAGAAGSGTGNGFAGGALQGGNGYQAYIGGGGGAGYFGGGGGAWTSGAEGGGGGGAGFVDTVRVSSALLLGGDGQSAGNASDGERSGAGGGGAAGSGSGSGGAGAGGRLILRWSGTAAPTGCPTSDYIPSAGGLHGLQIPPGCHSVFAKAWAGGGGGGDGGNGSHGGGGGYAEGRAAVNPGSLLVVAVGGGGARGQVGQGSVGGFPGGGHATGSSGNSGGGGGGGYSGLFLNGLSQADALLLAGGGGGGNGDNGTYGPGGAGGGLTGGRGRWNFNVSSNAGGGATQLGGGTAGTGGGNGSAGGALQGGNGYQTYIGGGGGGGYFGGGGGAWTSGHGGGGGGGSGFLDLTRVTDAMTLAGRDGAPANAGDADRFGAGAGGTGPVGTDGANGRVIVRLAAVAPAAACPAGIFVPAPGVGDHGVQVPRGCSGAVVKAWGGGGGGGTTAIGGGGGYAGGTLTLTAGHLLVVRVATGGGRGQVGQTSVPGYPGGGIGWPQSGNAGGGAGGGYSGIFGPAGLFADALLVAAGGGGGMSDNGAGGYGGAGGGSSGQIGGFVSTAALAGGGGSSTGGSAGSGTCNGSPGTQLRGGDGCGTYIGGGGGGGWYGGGGGAWTGGQGGGGGGGSSYAHPTLVGSPANLPGTGTTAGNNSDADRSGAATGGAVAQAGADGRVLIDWAP